MKNERWNKERIHQKEKNIQKSKLNGANIILAINWKAVSMWRYEAGIISWTNMGLEELLSGF